MKFFLFLILISFHIYSAEKNFVFKVMKKDNHTLLNEKNGISLEMVTKNFDKNFKFVATHFRDDKNELRLIYGNSKALQGFKTKSNNFEDGSIFYKVVYKTDKDPSFQASLRPQQQPFARQIMLRNKKKFKDTNGWGYAVFSDDGKTLPGDPDKTLATCYACHSIVGERNDVFSRPLETIVPNDKVHDEHFSLTPTPKEIKATNKLFKFRTGTPSEIPSDIIANIPKSNSYNIMIGEMLKQEFPGFMAEVNSFLMNETLKNGFPSVAFKKFNDQLIYSYSFIDSNDKSCKNGQVLMRLGFGNSNDFQTKSLLRLLKKCVSK